MTVEELIARLSLVPGSASVHYQGGMAGLMVTGDVERVEVEEMLEANAVFLRPGKGVGIKGE